MDKFTASNGLTVDGTPGRIIVRDRTVFPKYDLGKYTVEALREFFRAESDEELGRWRWPENPAYVVYPDEDGDVVVLNEGKGVSSSLIIRRDLAQRNPEHPATQAARAFFEAHPVREPWHDAKPGEVWVIDEAGRETTAARAGLVNERMKFEPVDNITRHIDVDDPSIIDARRIWPESS